MTSLIEAVGITKSFGATAALRDVSLSVRSGRSHALIGRNGAGKSTLVSILSGLDRPDTGDLRIAGVSVADLTPIQWREQVTTVYQRPTTFPAMTVAENMMLYRYPRGLGHLLNWRRIRREAADELEKWNIPVSPDMMAGDLTVEQRRLVEIARALSHNAPVVILDEPTAELEGPEVRRLLDKLNELRQRGITFLYISHHLSEVFEVCDDVTVLRNGRAVLSREVDGLHERDIVAAMVGDAGAAIYESASDAVPSDAPVLLSLEDFSAGAAVSGISLSVRQGEVLGIASQVGSGGMALGRAVAGAQPSTGKITLDGRQLRSHTIPARIRDGINWVPQDRHQEGFVAEQSIQQNLTLPILSRLGRLGFVRQAASQRVADAAISQFGVATWGPEQPVGDLSGGNQQKTVVARALTSDPRAVVMLRPSQGVDVASRTVLLERAREYARRGNAVLIVSDEPDDLRICDRVTVMFRGEFLAEFESGWDEAELVAAMEGVSPETEGTDA